MAARTLLDPRLLLFVVGCGGCEFEPEEISERCELVAVDGAPPEVLGGSAKLTADLRVACGDRDRVYVTSVAVSPSGLYLLYDDSVAYNYASYVFYQLDLVDGLEGSTITELPSRSSVWWPELEVDDDGVVSMFGRLESSLRRATFSEDWSSTPLGLDVGEIERVEIAGSQPHIWTANTHVTTFPDGTWFEEPAPEVEGMVNVAIGLDGSGAQLAYAVDSWTDAGELWTFDGASAVLVGEVSSRWIIPVPTAHPNDPSHEHAAVIESSAGIGFVWPTRESGTMFIPTSAAPSRTVAARTADGRVWIAWIVVQDSTLHVAEIDPEIDAPREVIRVELDNVMLNDRALGIAAFGQQLALAVADGSESTRVRVLSFDTSR